MDLTPFNIIMLTIFSWVLMKIIIGILDGLKIQKSNERMEALKYLDDMIHNVEVEKIGDIEYWYDKDDREFLGQGKTFKEIVEVLKIRFPTHVFLLKDKGALSKHTNWKLASTKELENIPFTLNQ